jgi:hypothetical protein
VGGAAFGRPTGADFDRQSHWIEPAAFLRRGTSGQWRDLLDDADLARYAARVRALAPDDLVDWLHREPID